MRTTPPDPLQMTYQQLEELDGLLQRMLAMTQRSATPTNDGEKSASDSHAHTCTDSLPATAELSVQHQVNTDVECILSTNTLKINDSTNQMPTVSLSRSNKHLPSSAYHTPLVDITELPIAEELVDKQMLLDNNIYYILLPFVYINLIYDKICNNLGWIGRLLHASITRNTLGIGGLLLFFYSLFWYIQSQGLIGWNVSVPWTLQDWYDIIAYRH